MRQYDVYGIGNALVDMEFAVGDDFLREHELEKGHMTLVEASRQHHLVGRLGADTAAVKRASGGSAANTLMALSAFGGDAYYSCRVADDEPGRFFIEDLRAAGVDCTDPAPHEATAEVDRDTGRCLIMVTPDAERTMLTHLGISTTLSRAQLDADALSRSRYLYVEGYLCSSEPARDAAVEARRRAREAGVETVLTLSDPSMVMHFREGLEAMVGDGVDHLFCNLEEGQLWTGRERPDEVAEALRATARTFALTLGKDGALVFDGETTAHVSAVPTEPVDTNGAGDMFAGAYLYGITHGMAHVDAARLAVRGAAQLIRHYGARMPVEAHGPVLEAHRQAHG